MRGRDPSDPAFVAEVCRAAIEAGATTINLPDTVGYSLPDEYAAFVATCGGCARRSTASRWPSTATTTWGSRLRTRSRASARAPSQVECTVNGIGERAGVAALEEVAMALRVRADAYGYETGIDVGRIGHASRLVSEADGLRGAAEQGDRRRERVRARGRHPPGRDAQARGHVPDHGSGGARAHDDAPARQALGPPRVQAGVHGGRAGADRDEFAAAFTRFKTLADAGEGVTLDDAFEEVAA